MDFLWEGFMSIFNNPKVIVMWIIGGILIFLAIKFDMEPALLLPMGFGAILINLVDPILSGLAGTGSMPLPDGGVIETQGIMQWLFTVGIGMSEAMPILLFIGIGAMIDFGPLLTNPKLFLLGGAAQFGIFITIVFAALMGFPLEDAASIGIIGAADGPTSIFVAIKLGSHFVAPIMVVAYSYMALVPIIQPAVIKLCTTKKERLIRMEYSPKTISRTTRILFPIIVTAVSGIIAPKSLSLIGFLMFGNLIRECGVLDTMSETAQHEFANIITLLLGITIAFQMQAENFVRWETLMIMALGLVAFVFDTFAGVMCAKLFNVFSKKKINPMIGAAGISAFPMSARVVHKMGLKEDPTNFLLMHAVGVNVSGQIASAIVGGLILTILL